MGNKRSTDRRKSWNRPALLEAVKEPHDYPRMFLSNPATYDAMFAKQLRDSGQTFSSARRGSVLTKNGIAYIYDRTPAQPLLRLVPIEDLNSWYLPQCNGCGHHVKHSADICAIEQALYAR